MWAPVGLEMRLSSRWGHWVGVEAESESSLWNWRSHSTTLAKRRSLRSLSVDSTHSFAFSSTNNFYQYVYIVDSAIFLKSSST